MPSFDIVSEVNEHEVSNAVDQANREVNTRFDFKGSNASFKLAENKIIMQAPNDFQLKQMDDILRTKLVKREVDVQALKYHDPVVSGQQAQQEIDILQGIEAPLAKKIVKIIKEKKLKVQAAIQGEQVRVSGKKRDDLQTVIATLKEAKLELPLQYVNFRD